MHITKQEHTKHIDNSRKSILARACDPAASLAASKAIPPLIGNPEYVFATDDIDFVEKLRSRDWSVVFFAPGACRFSAARRPIPGSNAETEGWTLDQYRELVQEIQGETIQIVETYEERMSVRLLKNALEIARETDKGQS